MKPDRAVMRCTGNRLPRAPARGSRPLRIKPSYPRSTSCLHTLLKNWLNCLNELNIAAATPISRRQSIFAKSNAACTRSRSMASRAPDPCRGMGTVTPERVTVLEPLASQAAISLENALLYADLQQENSERKRAEGTLRAREDGIR